MAKIVKIQNGVVNVFESRISLSDAKNDAGMYNAMPEMKARGITFEARPDAKEYADWYVSYLPYHKVNSELVIKYEYPTLYQCHVCNVTIATNTENVIVCPSCSAPVN